MRRRLGELCVELLAVRFTGYRMLSALQQGQIPGPEAGLAKVTTVNAAIDAGDLIADVLGPDALDDDSEWAYMISFLPGLKSAGGTEEILRNTIGERVLGLPPEPRLDKGIPFSELRAKEREAAAPMNLELTDEQELPARGGARRAVAREDRRGRARGARGPVRAARPVADRARGGLAGPARRRGAAAAPGWARSTRCSS